MKRTALLKTIKKIAKEQGASIEVIESSRGPHAKVLIDGRPVTTIPRGSNVKEGTAKSIIKTIQENTK